MTLINATTACTDELRAFSNLAKDFAAKELVKQREENDSYPFGKLYEESIRHACDVGFFGVNLPAEHGGTGMGCGVLPAILENLSMADASMAGIIFTNAAAMEIISQASRECDCGSLYQKLSEAESLPVAFQSFTGINENELPAVDKNGDISGSLRFLALGGISRYGVIPARAANGVTYYLVDFSHGGVRKSETVYSLGLHACPAVDVSFDRVQALQIGLEGAGNKYFYAMQSQMSVGAAAVSLGIMRGSFSEALQYAGERQQGGRQIINWNEVRMILANMAVDIASGEACLESACSRMEKVADGWELTARAAAIHIAELACRASVDGVQLLGGNGYMKDYGQEKRLRDSKQAQCFLGMAPFRKMDIIDAVTGVK
jgi:alkylation response protein AidB-like acyl-CoA dehydrogenase